MEPVALWTVLSHAAAHQTMKESSAKKVNILISYLSLSESYLKLLIQEISIKDSEQRGVGKNFPQFSNSNITRLQSPFHEGDQFTFPLFSGSINGLRVRKREKTPNFVSKTEMKEDKGKLYRILNYAFLQLSLIQLLLYFFLYARAYCTGRTGSYVLVVANLFWTKKGKAFGV